MSKKKTHAEYVAELAVKNPDIEVVGIYMGNKVKIPHRCKIDGNVWDLSPDNALRGRGCPKCAGNNKKTHEEYVKELRKKNPHIEVLEEYRGSQVNIMHRCEIHNFNWYARPNNILKGNGCPLCARDITKNKLARTHKEYVEELKNINPNIKVIGEYSGSQEKIMHLCLIHNYEWMAKPNNILQGCGCPLCGKKLRREKRTKTHEQYVAELAIKNPTVEVVEEYKTTNTKIMHHCLIHDVYWKITPSGALNGNGCEECRKEKFHKAYAKTTEQYVKEIFEANPNIEVIGEYIDAKTKLLHYCIIHDEYFDASPTNMLQGKTGCCICANESRRIAMSTPKEEYIERLHKISSYIDIIGDYVNMRTKTLHYCNKHNVKFETTPDNALRGHGCSECAKENYHVSRTRTTEEYISLVKDVNPNIEVLGEYIRNDTPILHKCHKHNVEWNAIPYGILHGCGCWKCRNEKISMKATKTHEEYINELSLINKDIVVLGQYIDCYTPILHRCLIDGNEWYARPVTMLQGGRCPVCSESKGERRIRLWLEKNNIEYVYQYKYEDCKDINILPFDFYLPTYNILIEYDGEQHFRPIEYFGGQEKFELQQKHDRIKNEYCKNNGIPLLRIPYFKYDNIEEELNNFLFI